MQRQPTTRTLRYATTIALLVTGLLLGGPAIAQNDIDDQDVLERPLYTQLTDNAPTPDAIFGRDVAIDGKTAVVGAPKANDVDGEVHVFYKTPTGWTRQAVLSGNGKFGASVAIEGDRLAVGAKFEDGKRGTVHLYQREDGDWTETTVIQPEGLSWNDRFGAGVDFDEDGDRLVVSQMSSPRGGAVHLYERTGGAWEQQASMAATPVGEVEPVHMFDVTLDGRTIVHTGPRGEGSGAGKHYGQAYVYTETDAGWVRETILRPDEIEDGDTFQCSALQGDRIACGAPGQDGTSSSGETGTAYVYQRTDAGWTLHTRLVPDDLEPGDGFGFDQALHGDTLAVSAWKASFNGIEDAGSIYHFTGTTGRWIQVSKFQPDTLSEGDGLAEVATTATVSVAGAILDDVDGTEDAGSAYVFTPTPVTDDLDVDQETEPPVRTSDVFHDSFEAYEIGTYPGSGWSMSASGEEQAIVEAPARSGERAFELTGDPGGCWAAVSHHRIPIPDAGTAKLALSVLPQPRSTDSCHPDRAKVKFETGPDYTEEHSKLLRFMDNGRLHGEEGTDLGTFHSGEWHDIQVTYQRADGEVSLTYVVDGEPRGTVTRETYDHEDEFSYLTLSATGGTMVYDNVTLTTTEGDGNAEGEASNDSASSAGPEDLEPETPRDVFEDGFEREELYSELYNAIVDDCAQVSIDESIARTGERSLRLSTDGCHRDQGMLTLDVTDATREPFRVSAWALAGHETSSHQLAILGPSSTLLAAIHHDPGEGIVYRTVRDSVTIVPEEETVPGTWYRYEMAVEPYEANIDISIQAAVDGHLGTCAIKHTNDQINRAELLRLDATSLHTTASSYVDDVKLEIVGPEEIGDNRPGDEVQHGPGTEACTARAPVEDASPRLPQGEERTNRPGGQDNEEPQPGTAPSSKTRDSEDREPEPPDQNRTDSHDAGPGNPDDGAPSAMTAMDELRSVPSPSGVWSLVAVSLSGLTVRRLRTRSA